VGQRMDFGRVRTQHRGTAQMATLAVGVVSPGIVVLVAGCRRHFAASLMLVLVMAEVLLCGGTGFVRAVRRRRAPDQLERHDEQQKCEHPTTHDSDSRLAVLIPARRTSVAKRGSLCFGMGCHLPAGKVVDSRLMAGVAPSVECRRQSRLASDIGTPDSPCPGIEARSGRIDPPRRTASAIGTRDGFEGVTGLADCERASSRLAVLIGTPVSGVSADAGAAYE